MSAVPDLETDQTDEETMLPKEHCIDATAQLFDRPTIPVGHSWSPSAVRP
jgi:hypothetical protein